MTTAIDTNVLVALWDEDDGLNSAAEAALDAAFARGELIISGAVFAELLAFPRRTEAFVDRFLKDTAIAVDWTMDESIWRAAGRAFQSYANRRRRHNLGGPRRVLADFLIGAHALERGHSLLTMDDRIYRTSFPALKVVSV
jgi:predicted nucleic acid-binding protein